MLESYLLFLLHLFRPAEFPDIDRSKQLQYGRIGHAGIPYDPVCRSRTVWKQEVWNNLNLSKSGIKLIDHIIIKGSESRGEKTGAPYIEDNEKGYIPVSVGTRIADEYFACTRIAWLKKIGRHP